MAARTSLFDGTPNGCARALPAGFWSAENERPPHPPQSRLERAGVFLMATTMQRPETTDHKIIYASSWVKAITGYEMAEFLGKDCRFLQGPDTDMAQCYKIRQVRRDRA